MAIPPLHDRPWERDENPCRTDPNEASSTSTFGLYTADGEMHSYELLPTTQNTNQIGRTVPEQFARMHAEQSRLEANVRNRINDGGLQQSWNAINQLREDRDRQTRIAANLLFHEIGEENNYCIVNDEILLKQKHFLKLAQQYEAQLQKTTQLEIEIDHLKGLLVQCEPKVELKELMNTLIQDLKVKDVLL